MTKKFSAYVQAHDSSGKYHSFAPGDAVPEWIAGKLGNHVIAGAAAKPAESDESEVDEDAGQEPAESAAEDAGSETEAEEPDFTKPAAPAKNTKKDAAKKG